MAEVSTMWAGEYEEGRLVYENIPSRSLIRAQRTRGRFAEAIRNFASTESCVQPNAEHGDSV